MGILNDLYTRKGIEFLKVNNGDTKEDFIPLDTVIYKWSGDEDLNTKMRNMQTSAIYKLLPSLGVEDLVLEKPERLIMDALRRYERSLSSTLEK